MDTRAFDLKPGDVVSDVWHCPVVVNYDGPPPEVIETLNKSPWKTLACRAKVTTPVGFGRNSKRQRRQTERLMRAAAKREAKP